MLLPPSFPSMIFILVLQNDGAAVSIYYGKKLGPKLYLA